MIQASSSLKQVDSVPDLVDNSWCVVSADEFKVRIGPSYSSCKKKDDSCPSILEILGVDAFTSSKKTDHIMQHIKPPTKLSDIVRDPQADFWCPNFMVLNVMLPAYPPSISVWSSPKDDGATYSLVIYFGFNQEIYDGMKNEDSNALRLLKKWLQADPQSKDDYEMRGRLKGIPVIQNKEDGNFGLLSSLVNMYNAKPFLTGPKHHRFVKVCFLPESS